MRFLRFQKQGRNGLAVSSADGNFFGFHADEAGYPGDLTPALLESMSLSALADRLKGGEAVDPAQVKVLAPITGMRKILCVGLNYVEHAAEGGHKPPEYPVIFIRFESTLTGDGAPLVRPACSEQFDYEGELVAVIGKRGRAIPKAHALEHVAGYTIFNDGSVRDYQRRTSQWTIGKNFESTGAMGPYLVSADALPRGASGLLLQTRLNGHVVQSASTSDMAFDVATLVEDLSRTMTLEVGDIIVTGTPSGVGMARKPPLWMKAGDICEVEIESIGLLRNPVFDENT